MVQTSALQEFDNTVLDTLAKRLNYARRQMNLSQTDIVNAVGCGKGTYSELENGKSLHSSYLLKIAEFLNVSILWLQNGEISLDEIEGDFLKSKIDQSSFRIYPVFSISNNDPDSPSKIQFNQVDDIALKSSFFAKRNLNAEHIKILECESDHLMGVINRGDLFAIDLSKLTIQNGYHYLVNFEDEIMLCQINKMGRGTIKISFSNPQFEHIVFDAEQFNMVEILGKIVWKSGFI